MKPYVRFIISRYGGEIIRRMSLEEILGRFGVDGSKIYYMLSRRYILRVLRGFFYVRTFDEIARGVMPDIYVVLSKTMGLITDNWFFGLYTALMLTGATHEYFPVYYIINDRLYRPKDINVIGHRVRILKFSKKLFGFGVISRGCMKLSDLERTIIDLAYWMRYRLIPVDVIVSMLRQYSKHVNKARVYEYLNNYPKSLRVIIDEALR